MSNKHLNQIKELPDIGETLAKDEEIITLAKALERAEIFYKLGSSAMGKEVVSALGDELKSISLEISLKYKTASHNELVAIAAKYDATETLLELFTASSDEIDELQKDLDTLIKSKAGQ